MKKIKKISKIRRVKKKKIWVPPVQINSSKIEKIFGIFLENLGFNIEIQFRISYKFYDFKIKDKKILIEFQGSYYHGDPKIYEEHELNSMQKKNKKNDEFKRKLAQSNGYKLLEVWEEEFNSNPNKIKEYLLKECV